MRVIDSARKTVKWDYQNSESVITIVAFLCDEPAWVKLENGVVMGLYVIGKDQVWLEKSRVDERKKKPFPCEASIEEVAGRRSNSLVIDDKTATVKFRYLLDDGRIAEYDVDDILQKKRELFYSGCDNLKKKLKEDEEHEI